MAQFELSLDPVLQFQTLLGNSPSILPAVVTQGVLAGVDGISITYDGRNPLLSERDLDILVSVAQETRTNLHIPPLAEVVQTAIDIPVHQVTFIGEDLFQRHGDDLGVFIDKLKKIGRLVSFRVEPELSQLKKAYRAGADFVELVVTAFTQAPSIVEQAEAREHLVTMARTAAKNGMGVAVSGGINFQNVQPLVNIEAIENIIAGAAIFNRALFLGLETAIRDFKGLVL